MPMGKIGGGGIVGETLPIGLEGRGVRFETEKRQASVPQKRFNDRQPCPGFLDMEKEITARADAEEIIRGGNAEILEHIGIQQILAATPNAVGGYAVAA